MNLSTESLEKLDNGFEGIDRTEPVDADKALRLLKKAVRGASAETDDENSKVRLRRLYCFGQQISKAMSETDDAVIDLPSEMIKAVQKDVEGEPENFLRLSESIQSMAKRFSSKEPVQKKEESNEEAPSGFATGIDLNSEDFDPSNIDWGADPDWTK